MATIARSKSSSAKSKPDVQSRPFAKEVLAKATAIVSRYAYVSRYETDDECYSATPVEMPLVTGYGETAAAAIKDATELATSNAAYALEQGKEPPPPGAEPVRTEQLNFRISIEEKARLEAAASRQGLTLIDFVRGAALAVGQITDPFRSGVR